MLSMKQPERFFSRKRNLLGVAAAAALGGAAIEVGTLHNNSAPAPKVEAPVKSESAEAHEGILRVLDVGDGRVIVAHIPEDSKDFRRATVSVVYDEQFPARDLNSISIQDIDKLAFSFDTARTLHVYINRESGHEEVGSEPYSPEVQQWMEKRQTQVENAQMRRLHQGEADPKSRAIPEEHPHKEEDKTSGVHKPKKIAYPRPYRYPGQKSK